jgi:preprotein translocase subunit SecF
MRYLPFNKWRNKGITASIFLVILSIILIISRGFNFSIDFTGGVAMEFKQSGDAIQVKEVRDVLRDLRVKDYSVQQTEDGIIIIQIGTKEKEDYSLIIERIKSVLNANFTRTDIEFIKVDFVSPKIGKELAIKGFVAVLISLIAVLLYVSIRFEFIYSVGAIIALMHDIIITFGFISALYLPFDVSTIAAILTVVGYSINDSVVIFDRIRENFKTMKEDNKTIIEASLNATLTRTLITSFTTLIAIFAIILLGGAILRPFASIVFFGIIIGTLSSIFISPILIFKRKSI